jgi:hypothetical protein
MVRQPNARLRVAVIAVLLARPDYAAGAQAAVSSLPPDAAVTLMLFYTAAVRLQRELGAQLRPRLGAAWQELPDIFAVGLGLGAQSSPGTSLTELATRHAELTGQHLNWEGTYRDTAGRLLRQWTLEALWGT